MDSPERKNRSKYHEDDMVRGSNGLMPVNPYFMPMYYPQYMPHPMGMPMAYPTNSIRGSYDYENENKKDNDLTAVHQSMSHMPVYNPMGYMPYPPMMMPGYHPQAVPQFSYSRSYFYPNEGKEKKKKDKMKDDDEDDEDEVVDKKKKQKLKKASPYKTSDQIVQEFKAYTLPKLRLKRLVKIQAVWRGWYVRNKVLPRKRLLYRLCDEIAERKVDEFLEVTAF